MILTIFQCGRILAVVLAGTAYVLWAEKRMAVLTAELDQARAESTERLKAMNAMAASDMAIIEKLHSHLEAK
jgi:hypothetical protein